MKRLRRFGERAEYADGFLSIGNFDGVHQGHQAILHQLCTLAHQRSAPAVVMTFEPHPISLLAPERMPPRLTSSDEKCRLLEELGVDVVLEYPTDQALLNLSAEQFFQRIVVDEFAALGLVEGPNFFFGRGRAGSIETLEQLCQTSARTLTVVPPTLHNGEIVSSSVIRKLLQQGDVARAADRLGRRYCLTGTVASGAGRGRELGFPTANLHDPQSMIPADGVYAAWASVAGFHGPAAVHIGPNPTFQDTDSKIEAHLIGFSGSNYGQTTTLEFVDRVRTLRSFDSPESLQNQISEDVAAVQAALA